MRRGFRVVATKGTSIMEYQNMPQRNGWSTAKPLEFSYDVDDTNN